MNGVVRRGALPVLIALMAAGLASVSASSAPTWLAPPHTLAQGEFGPSDVRVVVDAAGNATAAWVMDSNVAVTVQASTHPVGGTWSAPAILASGDLDNELDLAINAAGTAVAVWLRFDGSDEQVESATKAPGAAWSALAPVSALASVANHPQVAVDAAGNAVATWQGFDTTLVLLSATRTATGAWSASDEISVPADGSAQEAHELAITPSGQATAAWEFFDTTLARRVIQSAVAPAGGSFGDPVTVSSATVDTWDPALAVNAGGVATVAWREEPVGTAQVKAATRSAGGAWSGPQDVSASGGFNLDPDVVVDAAGTATAVWTRDESLQPGKIQYSRHPAGGTWAAPQDLDNPTIGYEDPSLAIDASGRVTAAYVENLDSGNDVATATQWLGASWTSPVTLSSLPSGTDARSPRVAMDDAGQAVVAWLGHSVTEDLAQVRALDSAGPLTTGLSVPTTATVGQPATFGWPAIDAWSAVSSVAWSFGDGGAGSGSSVAHTFAAPGSYAVSVTATDAVGNATTQSGTVTVKVPAPVLTGVKLTKKTIHVVGSDDKPRATKLKLKLNTAAKVIVKLKRTKKVDCKSVKAKVTKSLKAGKRAIRLTSKVGGKKLPPGTYKITVRAKNAVGTSPVKTLKLKIRK